MFLIECGLMGLAGLLLLPVAVLAVQVLMALPGRREPTRLGNTRPRVAILMPAHNEASGIADALRSIVPQLTRGDRLLVVADNCSDDTARVAAAAGAEVVERFDRKRRGKGYALDFGVRHLQADAPDVVIIVDADCLVGPGGIERLAGVCKCSGRPVQGLYLMRSPQRVGLKARIAEFAWVVKNYVRPLGYSRLGLPCQLMGTGMAFPWPLIATASLASGHIVEDMMLGIELAKAGKPSLFCVDAVVTSNFPCSEEGTESQRTRWEHGHLGVIASEAGPLLAEAVRRLDVRLLALMLDLCIPPLALLLMTVFLACFLGLGMALVSQTVSASLLLAALDLLILATAVLLSWYQFGRQIVSLRDLAAVPAYALWKIPLYLKFVMGKQVEWVRSKRDQE